MISQTQANAQESEAFEPPRAHPLERYETGWRKNPFVLKTAPVVPEPVSFARDWIIAGCFGAADNPSVILVNTKTRERTRLKKGEPASNGMSLHSVTFSSSRKDTLAEVSLGNATAVLRFDETYLKQSKGQQKSQVAAGRSQSSGASEGAAGSTEPVASIPHDQGAGFPYTYGNNDDKGTVASVEEGSPTEGRRRLLTAQKPVGGRR